MIQDIYPHILNNHYFPDIKPNKEDIVLCINDGKILLDNDKFTNNEIAFLKIKDLDESYHNDYRYLFSIDKTNYFLLDRPVDLSKNYTYVLERELRKEGVGPSENLFAAITGKHLADWYRDNKYCGRCGNKMIHSLKERAMCCNNCGYTSYPRIMPAVIVGVINGDSILITRYKTGFRYNALIAGFVEIGETVEEACKREVFEESGLHIKNIRYYKSQPWGSANDILLGFYCDVDGNDSILMDDDELKYASFVKREDIMLQPGEFSLTNEMMKMFKEGSVK